jgi:signal transduction histidine kinase
MPAVAGDPKRLQQVLWNLLSNAIKFTPKEGRVEVSADSTATHMRIRVRDTGPGIKPDLLHRIFEPFIQGEGSLKRSYGGLGLGLAITRHLVELHGGMVKAESPGEGKGSIFTVTIPLRHADQRAS